VTSYRYATEYSGEGEPGDFITKDLGWTGKATVSNSGDDKVNLRLDLTNVKIGTPRVYDVEGFQATMPAFTSVKIPDQELTLTPGKWRFVKSALGDDVYFWALRIAN